MTRPPSPSLDRMFCARSVAVVGASPRTTSAGYRALDQLLKGGYGGRIVPVNPNYDEVLGLTCAPSLTDIGDSVDLVLLAVPNELLAEQMELAAAAGAGAAVIFASGHSDESEAEPLTDRLSRQARSAGIAICGGNCMGFVDVERSLRALAFPEEDLEPGNIAWISHSGSAFTALLHNDRLLRFNLAVSAGQELTTTIADYMSYALERSSTEVIALFLETVRDPGNFVGALRTAAQREVPVVCLRVGVEELSGAMVAAHSGALAGNDGAYEALFEEHGVVRVGTLNEMADTLELLSAGRRAAPGGLATIHDSGGERAHLVDVAARVGVPFGKLSAATTDALGRVLEPGLVPDNPLDAWGTGNEADRIFGECMGHLLADDDVGALAFVVDFKKEEPEESYAPLAMKVFGSSHKPFALVGNLSSAIDREAAEEVRRAGVPVLTDTETGLRAFRHLFDLRDRRALPSLQAPAGPGEQLRARWSRRLKEAVPPAGAEALALVEDYGIAVAPYRVAGSGAEALEAARAIGYPVVLKTASSRAEGHKTEHRGVALELRDPAELAAAYAEMALRLGPEVLVQAMAPPGVELALGVVNDEQFGALVMVAAGGVLIEVLRDRRFAVPPLDEPRAVRLLDRLAVRPLLDGVRGRPAADIGAVVNAVVGLSVLAADLGEHVAALDINPLICAPDGCVAVDALVIPAPATP